MKNRLNKLIGNGLLWLAMLCFWGCGKMDERVYLSIQMDNNVKEHEQNPEKYADTGLKLFINGNICQFLRLGSSAGPVDKFLKPGRNTLEVKGSTAHPVEITISSFRTDQTAIRTILDQKWTSISTSGIYQASFRVNKRILLPIFDKKNSMPTGQGAEQEVTLVVSNLYRACITKNKEEFLQIAFEGYKIHSPSEYLDVLGGVGALFDGFELDPFPNRVHFIHGRNLLFVYSDTSDSGTVLFPAATKYAASVAGVDFAYVGNHWIVW